MTAPKKIEFKQVDIPQISDDQILVKVMRIGVCGSDIHVWHGTHPFTSYPVTQGHEVACQVVEIGKNVTGFHVGQKVTVQPQVTCGKCYLCRHGKYNLCEELKVMGFQTTGLASEYFAVPAKMTTPLPDEMSYDEGAMIEPLAVAVHAVRKAGDVSGKDVASQGLREDGLVSKRGCSTWCSNTITNILKNEKYAGNAVLGKTYKPDVLSKKRFKNDGSKSPMYYAENTHPAIIDEETFELAKEEMERRQNDKQKAVGRSRYSSKYPFSGILVCGNCGSRLRRHLRKVGSGKRVPAWGCANRIINGRAVCDSHHVNEDVLQRTYLAALQTMVDGSEEIIEAIEKSAATEMRTDADIDNIEQKIIAIQEEVLTLHRQKQRLAITEEDYQKRLAAFGEQMKELEEQRKQDRTAENRYAAMRLWLDEFKEHTESGDFMNDADGSIMKALVEKIIVKDASMEICFKCGVSIEQEYVE